VSKPRGFLAKHGPLNPAPPTEILAGDPPRLAFHDTAFQEPGELLESTRAAVCEILAKGLPPELAAAGVQGPVAFAGACYALGRDPVRELARLPRRVRLAYELGKLLSLTEAYRDTGEGEKTARVAFLAGALAVRLHVLPWERLALAAWDREQFKRLPPKARQIQGARQALRRRWAEQRKAREGWRRRAREVWREAPDLSAAEVARRVVAELPEPAPAVSTVRKALKGLRPGQ